MTQEAGGTITLLAGAVGLRLVLTGGYKRYVKAGMGPILLISALVLLALGIAVIARALRAGPRTAGRHGPGDEHDSDDEHAPERVGWLVLVPVLAVLLVAPPALGAFAVDRTTRVDIQGGALYEPLPRGAAPRSMTLLEFLQRADDRDGASMTGASVVLTGFVAGGRPGGFRLVRYSIACCAADAAAAIVGVDGVRPPGRDQWVRVTGSYVPRTADRPVLAATGVEPIAPPEDPYD